MGFFTKQMSTVCHKMSKNKSVNKKKGSQSNKKKVIPAKYAFSEKVLCGEEAEINAPEKYQFDEKRLLYMKNLLNRNVNAIRSAAPPTIISGDGESCFAKYTIDTTLITGTGYTKKYYAKHVDFPEMVLLAKYIKKLDNIPNRDYLKMISFLGRKQTFIIGFWDIFLKPNNMEIVVMQELASHRDMGLFVSKSPTPIPEWQCCYWIRQIFRALDFLGDLGICHRSVSPKYILLQGDRLVVKLSHFYEAMIYWNPQAENLIYLPCVSKVKQKLEDFQAPEVYGNAEMEEFDPIGADIWSMGAVMYFTMTRSYPYNVQNRVSSNCTYAALKTEIDNNIHGLSHVTGEGKQFLQNLLNPLVLQRVTFERISSLPWLNMHKEIARSNGFI